MKRLLQTLTIAGFMNLICACNAAPDPHLEVADNATIRNHINQSPASKLLMVHVWATWCPPCVEEFPVMMRVARSYRKNVELLLISADDPQTPEVVTAFLLKHNGPQDSLIAASLNQDFIETLSPEWPGALPATFFYRAGKLVAAHTGAMNAQQYKELIEPLL